MQTATILASFFAVAAMALPSPSAATDAVKLDIGALHALATTLAETIAEVEASGSVGARAEAKITARNQCVDDCVDEYCSNNMFTIVTPGTIAGLEYLGWYVFC